MGNTAMDRSPLRLADRGKLMAALRLERASPSDSTTAFNGQAAPVKRCKVNLVAGSGEHLSSEIGCLLRRRLRVAVLIALAGFLLFLVRNFIEKPEVLIGSWYLVYHTALVV